MLREALAAFQPQEIGFIADPYPAYDELRRAGRIHYDGRTAFETILRRMPRLELLAELEWKPTYIIPGLKSLPVRA